MHELKSAAQWRENDILKTLPPRAITFVVTMCHSIRSFTIISAVSLSSFTATAAVIFEMSQRGFVTRAALAGSPKLRVLYAELAGSSHEKRRGLVGPA
jgi:hypothetical protein